MQLIEMFTTRNKYYNEKRTIKPEMLVLHSTGDGVSSPYSHQTYFNTKSCSASVHAFISAKEPFTVIQTLPWTLWAAHAGGSANNNSIGVEMCEPDGIHYISGATIGAIEDLENARKQCRMAYETAVELFALLCVKYNIAPYNIYGHGELKALGRSSSSHVDPEHLWNQLNMEYTMDGFRKEVSELVLGEVWYNKLEEVPEAYRPTIYKLINSGWLQGTADGKYEISREMARIFTILDRAGVFDGKETETTI